MVEKNIDKLIKECLEVKSIKKSYLCSKSFDEKSIKKLLNSVEEQKLFYHAEKFLNETKKRDIFQCMINYSQENQRFFLDISKNFDGTYLGNFYKTSPLGDVKVLVIEGVDLNKN